ncbi:MAG: hypothetical protein ACYC7D_07840 [Nitrososphaerales archaeon]
MKNPLLALILAVVIVISGVAGYGIGASVTSGATQTTTVLVISTNFATPTTSIETTNTSTYCIQTGIHGTLYVRVVADGTNQPVSGANVTATIMNHCGSEYPVWQGLTNSTGYSSGAGWTGNFVVSVEYAGTNYTFPATTSGAVSLATLSIPSGVAVEKTIACGGLGCVDTTTTTTASSSSITAQSSSTPQALSDRGTIQILNGTSLETFAYIKWNSSTPNTFTISNVTFTLWSNVTFTLWTNSTVTYTGGSCYGPSNGYSGYVIKFSDGSTQTLTTCAVGFNAPMTIRLTNHTHPQVGLLIVPSTGAVYFLVSE